MNPYYKFVMSKMVGIDQHQLMIDEFMCSDVCQCWDEPLAGESLNRDKKELPSDLYKNVTEDKLNQYGRTKVDRSGYRPLKYTTDASTGFTNFEQCLKSWILKASNDKSIDLK